MRTVISFNLRTNRRQIVKGAITIGQPDKNLGPTTQTRVYLLNVDRRLLPAGRTRCIDWARRQPAAGSTNWQLYGVRDSLQSLSVVVTRFAAKWLMNRSQSATAENN